ncbi:phosphoribosylanthranilate isomerase [Kordiimonas pumila]|uniref:N-(5'-phosphoribosyl)anthranilate isomerase n=1 Tax=Kordiimonas pumila TaxID=2161677 RepID=A0ABV7CZS1_9PROT|nr:phosphoribosylanthranilate isomerase [Kordiimonas pumila]
MSANAIEVSLVSIDIKICGIHEAEHAKAAAAHGAAYVGFIFFAKSPRNLTLMEAMRLAPNLPSGPKRVGVFVNADIPFIKARVEALTLDMIQLHGSEKPADVALIKAETGLPVIKALAVSEESDIQKADTYSGIADMILFDAKPPKGAVLPGGNAVSFPWGILKGKNLPYPWLMAGGLTPENAAAAIAASGATALDVSSGVETEPGKKSSELIKAFLTAVKGVKESTKLKTVEIP